MNCPHDNTVLTVVDSTQPNQGLYCTKCKSSFIENSNTLIPVTPFVKYTSGSGGITITGAITGADGFTGDVTGNVTGDLTGDITGDLTGDVTGDLTGDVTGNLTGNVTGDVTGNITGYAGKVKNGSAPVNAVGSTLSTDLVGDNNDLVYTAKTKGVIGDSITVEYVAPNRDSAILSLDTTGGTNIKVNLEANADGGAASLIWGAGDGQVTITAVAGGTYSHVYSAVAVKAGSANASLSAAFASNVLTVTLGTDALGDLDPAKNTATLVAGVIDALADFLGAAGGTGADPVLEHVSASLAGGTDPTIKSIASELTTAFGDNVTNPTEYALVSVANKAGNNGTGVVTAMNDGGAGTGESLSAGVNGTVGVQWVTLTDSSYFYVCIATNTIADANWRRVTLGSAY